VHYWADLLSVHEFRCHDNIHICKLIVLYIASAYSAEREMPASACTGSMAGYYFAPCRSATYYGERVCMYLCVSVRAFAWAHP